MAEVDTRPYATIGGGSGSNPLAPLATIAHVQNAMNQNALFQQTFRARAAMGPIIQRHVDKNTGNVDWAGAAVDMAIHPETSFMAPEFMNQILQKELTEQQILHGRIENAKEKYNAMAGAAAALRAKPGKLGLGDMISEISGLLPDYVKPEEAIAHITQNGHLTDDASIRQHAGQMQISAMTAQERLNNMEYKPDLFYDKNTGDYKGGYIDRTMMNASVPGSSMGGIAAAAGGGGVPGMGAGASPAPAPAVRDPSLELGKPGAARLDALKQSVEYGQRVKNTAATAQGLDLLMKQVQDYLPHFQQGGGEQFRGRLAQLAQAAHMDKDFIEKYINEGSLADKQAAQKLFFNMSAMVAGKLIHDSGGRLTQSEWAQWLSSGSPNMDLDEHAIKKIMNGMKEFNHFAGMERKHYTEYTANPTRDRARVQDSWQDILDHLLERR